MGDDVEALTEKLSNQDLENDEVFQRLRTMLQSLIDDAENALLQKTKVSGGRVLHDYEPTTISAEPSRLDTSTTTANPTTGNIKDEGKKKILP